MNKTDNDDTFADLKPIFEPQVGPAKAVRKAIDAVLNDPRREPYGHHQHGREYIRQSLERLLAEYQQPPSELDLINFLEWLDTENEVLEFKPEAEYISHEECAKRYLASQ